VATSTTYPIGIIIRDPEQDQETQAWTARAAFAGSCYALAASAIPSQGGVLEVVNGKVQVSQTDAHAGIIAPLSTGESDRVAGSLVLVHLR